MTLDGKAAFENFRRSNASWKSARQKLRRLFVIPDIQPKFSISPADSVMTLGSCFARNVEQYLADLGCDVPASQFSVPADEQHAERATGILNIFTPPIFSQSMKWTAGIFQRDGIVQESDCERFAFRLPDGQVIDLGLASVRPVNATRFLERRQQVYDLFVKAFEADCFIITPGLIESWLDHETGLYTNLTPMRNGRLLDEKRFSFEVLNYQKCFDSLIETINIVRDHNNRIKTLITVSPVPLNHTFSGKGILLANSYSKAVLRAVCETIANTSDAIDYFPSYEAVNLSRFGVWQRDRRHVRDRFVAKIVRTIGKRYMLQ
jgi:hypothetical protein